MLAITDILRSATKTRRGKQILFILVVLLLSFYLISYIQIYTPVGRSGRVDDPLPPETTSEDEPILIWWTPFTPYKRVLKSCSRGNCVVTQSRTEYSNPRTEAIIFYGTDLRWTDLPLPRIREHYWALLHEESPKNNWGFAYEDGISLFNLTSTPSRYSSYPLVTQYLEELQDLLRPMKYTTEEKSAGGRGLVMYLQTDCDPPSDRDSYVSELMKYVKVDSYGKCLHNKDLPEHLRDPVSSMDAEELVDIISQYKFTLAMENAVCNDYITEKFWRPLYAGSVPIVKGSPTIKDWAPSDHSIILIDDYSSPEELAKYLLYLDKNDDEYEKYLEFKQYGTSNMRLLETMNEREWRVHDYTPGQINHVDGFECFVCDRAIEKRMRRKAEEYTQPLIASTNHYDCEFPKPLAKRQKRAASWLDMLLVWRQVAIREKHKVHAVAEAIREGKNQGNVTSAYNSVVLKDNSEYKLREEDYIDSV